MIPRVIGRHNKTVQNINKLYEQLEIVVWRSEIVVTLANNRIKIYLLLIEMVIILFIVGSERSGQGRKRLHI